MVVLADMDEALWAEVRAVKLLKVKLFPRKKSDSERKQKENEYKIADASYYIAVTYKEGDVIA